MFSHVKRASLVLFFATVSCLLLIASPLSAFAQTTGAPYTIAYKFTTGQQLKFGMSMDMNTQTTVGGTSRPINMHMHMSMTQTVQSVQPDGSATLQTSLATDTETMNGQPMPTSSMPKINNISETLSPSGQILNLSGMPSSPMTGNFNPNTFGMQSFLPTKPVNIGDTWTASVPIAMIGATINATMTLVAVSPANIATINTVMTSTPLAATPPAATTTPSTTTPAVVPPMNMTMNGTGTTLFDITNGDVVSTDGHMTIGMTMTVPAHGAQPSHSMNMNMIMHMLMNLEPASTTH
jgi:hypothetical protein